MVSYTISRVKYNGSSVKTTVYVEGVVNLDDWDKLKIICLDTLKNTRRFVLNMERLFDYDYPAASFVCLLKKIAQRQGGRILILKPPSAKPFICEYEGMLEFRTKPCYCTAKNTCYVWTNLSANSSFC